ncbi:MAG TPA: flagellar motor switch protein FliM, partial [Mycoplana sp.]|nr:flagellar motor switch protein FliM [Mycoplana sp.]
MTTSAMPKHDPIVLARLTGQLGDREAISRRCAALGEVFAAILPDILQRELGFEIAVSYAGYEIGRYGALISGLGGAMALADCALPDWSDQYAVVCDSPLIITLVENMLGAVSDSIEEPEPRPLSQIELDVAAMVFNRICGVLPTAVGNGNEPAVGSAHNV